MSAGNPAMRDIVGGDRPPLQFRKWLILTHRYAGIVLSFFFVMWFLSGIAMIYGRGMPGFTPDMRLERLAELNMGAVKVTASEAVAKAELDRAPARARTLAWQFAPSSRRAAIASLTRSIGRVWKYNEWPPF